MMKYHKSKKVGIILLNYNTTNDVIECVESLQKITYDNYEIIVVDNCSQDEEVNKLHKYIGSKEKCIFIKSDKNGGFAYGNNLGIKYSIDNNFDYVLLLNGDTIVNDRFLDILVSSLEKESDNIAIVTGKIMYYPEVNKIWYGGGEIDWNKFIGKHYSEGENDIGQCNNEREVSFASGCLMLINLKLNFDKFLPDEYFMYYEDVDYCARVLEAGYKIIYNPNSIIYHKIGGSSGGEQSAFTIRWANRGRYIFMNKYKFKFNRFKFEIIKIKFLTSRVVKCIFMCLKGDFYKAKELYRGLKEVLI